MSLKPGTTLGPYQVTAKIGEGGMGEVYRARDTKLDRDVALKVLPEAFTQDPDRLARFEREAKVLASLNHPNIAAIYGLEEAEGVRALVLELVEGPTLADRIKRGPIALDEALPIAKQIAEALEAAHEAGVIHRDLKPANIKVRDDGTVKVLDFGLAKAFQPDASDPTLSQSPTISLTAAATQMGMVVGTAAYMAPEQAKGLPVDRRVDIWAFGAVLFEMLTGKKLFDAGDVSEMLASVLVKDPDISSMGNHVPAHIRSVVRRCLVKDPKKRIRDIGDVSLAMEGTFETAVGAVSADPTASQPTAWRQAVPWVAGIAIGGILAGVAVWTLTRTTAATPRVSRSSMEIPPGVSASGSGHNNIALSPSGSHLVWLGANQLWIRAMDQIEATPIPRTEGATEPFFSPGGEWIGFWSDDQLRKVSITGGAPVTLCEIDVFFGASWGPDDTILLGSPAGVWRVPGSGGTPEVIVPVEAGEIGLGRPQLLPGGEWVLLVVAQSRSIAIHSLVTGERKVLIENGGDVRYLPTGHLAYVLDGTLLAVPFDVEQLTITGGPVPLVEGINQEGVTGFAQFAHAADGTLVYQRGGGYGGQSRTLVWVDRQGNDTLLDVQEARSYTTPRLSPDGTHLAVTVLDENVDVWVSELALGTLRRLTTDPAGDLDPLWTPDGERVVFASYRGESPGLFSMAWDGTGDAERLMTIEQDIVALRPYSWSPDGAVLFEFLSTATSSYDIGILRLEGDGTWEPLLDTEADERAPAISPDGQWIAYASDRTGTREIYVARFPELGSEQIVSRGGGDYPVWSQDGRELFYQRVGIGLIVVPLESGPTLRVGIEETLFDLGTYYSLGFSRSWDVSPDGQRFLMSKLPGDVTTDAAGQLEIIVVQNWFEELKERVPVP